MRIGINGSVFGWVWQSGGFKSTTLLQFDMPLVAFDFDGTLSDSEMTVLLGERCGVADEMAAITERAMNNEIEYAESLRSRVQLLAGLSGADAKVAFERVTLRDGAAELLAALDAAGVRTAILTGGFERGVRFALEEAAVDVDTIVANRLAVEDRTLTGDVSGPLIEGTKDVALRALADDAGIPLGQTIAVGDGANDLPMLRVAGYSIGFQPKPAVVDACDVTVSSMAELRELFVERDLLVT